MSHSVRGIEIPHLDDAILFCIVPPTSRSRASRRLDAALARLRDLGVSDFSGAIAAVDGETGRRTLEYLAMR
jgi:hypothetical protein